MPCAMRKSRGSASSDGREFRRLELESGADVDCLAVAPVVLQRRHAIALDIVANATRQSDTLRERVGPADVERVIVGPAESLDRASVRPICADRDATRKLVERIA